MWKNLIYIIGVPVSLYMLWDGMVEYFFACVGLIISIIVVTSIVEFFEKPSKGKGSSNYDDKNHFDYDGSHEFDFDDD